ncbi:MAG: hypothetical protein ACRDX8_08285 [Acidimicrobiales bacterium]
MREIRWTEKAEDHIAAHAVTPDEVEQVVNTRPRLVLKGREGTEYLFGMTDAGRHLLIVLADRRTRLRGHRTRDDRCRAPGFPAQGKVRSMTKLDEIAAHAASHDFAAEIDQGVWEDDTEPDPMVTTSLRLPKSLLDWVRERATDQHVRPSVLIRQWVEQRRDADGGAGVEDLALRVERLERAVFIDKRAS